MERRVREYYTLLPLFSFLSLSSLSLSVWLLVLPYVSPTDLVAVMRLCRASYRLSRDPSLWRDKFEQSFRVSWYKKRENWVRGFMMMFRRNRKDKSLSVDWYTEYKLL